MKVLLDECVPVQVRHALAGHEIATAQQMGWSGISNGELLAAAEQAGFELFILADKISGISKIWPGDGSRFWNFGPTIGPR